MKSLSEWTAHFGAQRLDRVAAEKLTQLKSKHLASLTPEARSRFGHLEMLRQAVANRSSADQDWYRKVVGRLDALLERFLLLAVKQVEFAKYLDALRIELGVFPPSTQKSPGAPHARLIADEEGAKQVLEGIGKSFQSALSVLEKSLGTEANPHNKALIEKRREVLNRRSQHVVRLGEIIFNISHQLKLMEDTFGLVNDEIRTRTPAQVLSAIDDLIVQTDQLSDRLRDIAPLEQTAG